MLLATERLTLRPATLDDVDALVVLWREPLVRQYLLDDRVVSRQQVEGYVASFRQSGDEHGHYLWIVEGQDGAPVGFAALKEIPDTAEVEVYYGLAPEFWGQGLATEAARAVLAYGFDVLGLPRIWARTDPSNEASKRVARRLGMTPADDPGDTSLASYVMERMKAPSSLL
jgi:RimJ/RimL family protein N-acetyltransferase